MRVFTVEQKKRAAEKATKHGLSKTKLYKSFHQMKQRCYNPKNPSYQNYGGRGIEICCEWLNDINKFAEWAYENGWDESKSREEQTIDRIDVNGDYSPNNCRLIPMSEQYFNRTDTHYITIDGITKTIKEWSQISGVSMTVINARIVQFGWDAKEAVYRPARKMRTRTGTITYNGQTHTLAEWSKLSGIPLQTLSSRVTRNCTLDEIFSKEKLPKKIAVKGESNHKR